MKRILSLSVAFLLAIQLSTAQSIELAPTVVASAGGYGEAGDISLSWTLGELAVTTLEAGDLILTQGFQQSKLGVVGIREFNPVDWEIIAYPNPVDNELKLQFELMDPADFIIEIQDVSGRVISLNAHDNVNSGDIVPVDMSDYKHGVYFFNVYTPDRQQVRVISVRKL